MSEEKLKIVMYPWLAMAHLTGFLHLSNKLAERGHSIFFILPTKTQSKLNQFNLHPHLITFIPITIPHVQGLPEGAETTADIRFPMGPLLRHAMDLTRPFVHSLLQEVKPHFVLYDFTHWLPALARGLGVKSVCYWIVSPASVGYLLRDDPDTDALLEPPTGFPPSVIKLYPHEVRSWRPRCTLKEYGCDDMNFVQRLIVSVEECDALGFKSCREMEGPYCVFLEKKYKKPVILAGPVLPEPPTVGLDEKWRNWLDQFEAKTVIFCAFGSEAILKLDQFQELVLGLEITGLPFLAVLKPPEGCKTVVEALPEGFKNRTEKRGVIHGGWVQQQLILSHPSIGCFVTHCGSGSLSEAMVNECQLVLIPYLGDHFLNARLMEGDWRVGVEVKRREEDGFFTKEGVMESIRLVMEEESEIGKEIRANHGKWRDFLLTKGLEDSYMDEFVQKLGTLLVD
ncbi:cyanidin 3-O-galactoside 2''-O-xylosyltransferase FGGT1-like [Henckelia pumila]|uniref:cyanidin 3-O-galactoside 2''-O-xylosyltransferase FGGT1-like n=1 Tax=Henckelia pumila TaxID=405737 RepID=UPI003C6E3476